MIGAGSMGREHIRRINTELRYGEVTSFYDAFPKQKDLYYGAELIAGGEDELIASKNVDAVMICSPDTAHKGQVLKCIKAGKPVFCEKPLGLTAADCKEIMDAEEQAGRKFVTVGFMRRYDQAYQKMREMLSMENYLGNILMIHSKHRSGLGGIKPEGKPIGGPGNVDPLGFNEMTKLIVTNGPIHDVDTCRYLIGDAEDKYVSAQAIFPRGSYYNTGSANPMFILLKTEKGIMVTIEFFSGFHLSYDIQCEVVCEDGVINLPPYPQPRIRRDMNDGHEIPTNWLLRFNDAYDREIQDWINGTLAGEVRGAGSPDAWICACATDAMKRSIDSGKEEPIIY